MLAMTLASPLPAICANPGTASAVKKTAKKKVTSTTGKHAPTEGVATTNAVAVDLGLPSGTKWADRNVGAEAPHAYGGLYRYGNKGKTSGEGCPKKNIAGTALDVATKKMGAKWQTPTQAQIEELWNETTHTHDVVEGVKGFRLTGPNGNSIFLPFTGTMYNYGRSQAGEFAFYTTGELTESWMYQVGVEVIALELWEKDDNTFVPKIGSTSIGEGNPIRAVLK